MTYENFVKAKLLEFAAREAHQYGGTNAMCAVAQVIYNRVQAGWGEWLQVIDSAEKFQGTLTEPVRLEPMDMAFRRMLTLIDNIYYGLSDYGVNVSTEQGDKKALYYADLSELNRAWFNENIMRNDAHPCIATVAQLSFFA